MKKCGGILVRYDYQRLICWLLLLPFKLMNFLANFSYFWSFFIKNQILPRNLGKNFFYILTEFQSRSCCNVICILYWWTTVRTIFFEILTWQICVGGKQVFGLYEIPHFPRMLVWIRHLHWYTHSFMIDQ